MFIKPRQNLNEQNLLQSVQSPQRFIGISGGGGGQLPHDEVGDAPRHLA